MDIIKLIKNIKNLFSKRKTINDNPNCNNEPSEKILAYRELDQKLHQEMRIQELEEYVQKSFDANNYTLTYMENKVNNIAGHIAQHQKLTGEGILLIFKRGVLICDQLPAHPIKIGNVAKYFYENYYSEEKQLKYYAYTSEVSNKYAALEAEIEKKYKD